MYFEKNINISVQARLVYFSTRRNIIKDIRRTGIDRRVQNPFLFCNHSGKHLLEDTQISMSNSLNLITNAVISFNLVGQAPLRLHIRVHPWRLPRYLGFRHLFYLIFPKYHSSHIADNLQKKRTEQYLHSKFGQIKEFHREINFLAL